MKHNITKEVIDYLNEYKPEKFYSYALFRNVYKDADLASIDFYYLYNCLEILVGSGLG